MEQDDWMWVSALSVIASAERIRQPMFTPRRSTNRLAWEPPVDVLELEHEVLILVALPGVNTEDVQAVIDNGALVVAGRRILPPQLRTAMIHRLELPHGIFERRIPLPAGRYAAAKRTSVNGCLLISLQKIL